jgi:hypothetical protein
VLREVDVEFAVAVGHDILMDDRPAVPVVAADSDQSACWETYYVLELRSHNVIR